MNENNSTKNEVEKLFVKNERPVEYRAIKQLDRDGHYRWVAESRAAFKAEQAAKHREMINELNAVHRRRLAEFKKDIAMAMTKRELNSVITDMITHDKVMAHKAGYEIFDTFKDLERSIISAENRICFKPKTAASDDLLEKARKILQKKGVIRLEAMDSNKMEKVKFAFNIKSFVEISNAGYKMVILA